MKKPQNQYRSYEEFEKALLPKRFAEKKEVNIKPMEETLKRKEVPKNAEGSFGLI